MSEVQRKHLIRGFLFWRSTFHRNVSPWILSRLLCILRSMRKYKAEFMYNPSDWRSLGEEVKCFNEEEPIQGTYFTSVRFFCLDYWDASGYFGVLLFFVKCHTDTHPHMGSETWGLLLSERNEGANPSHLPAGSAHFWPRKQEAMGSSVWSLQSGVCSTLKKLCGELKQIFYIMAHLCAPVSKRGASSSDPDLWFQIQAQCHVPQLQALREWICALRCSHKLPGHTWSWSMPVSHGTPWSGCHPCSRSFSGPKVTPRTSHYI